jgi:hypothetical protein
MAVWSIILGISWSKNIPYDIELKVHEVFSTVQFVENKGIYNNEVLYFSTSRNVFVLKDGTIIANGIELKFGEPKEIKLDMLTPTGFSYFSNDKALDLETYARVVLKSAYKNIDVMLTSLGKNQLEFQFIVKPKANVNDIKLIINNAESIEEVKDFIKLKKTCIYERPRILNEDEKEYPKEIDCSIYIKKPEAYQGSEEVKVYYEIRNNVLSYKVEKYDKNKTLIIDPTAILTSSSADDAYALAIDNSGNVFVGGETRYSSNFATNRVIYGTAGHCDAFVVKLSNNLNVLYRTAILGPGGVAYALAIDNSGNVFVGGVTGNSSNFATNRVIYGTTGASDAFVVKLSNDLNTLYTTAILTSSSTDIARALAIDNSGNVFVGGYTRNSSNFATNRVIYGTTGSDDAFVVKLSNGLDTLYRTAILTSSSDDYAYALAIDNNGNVFVGGYTENSSNFATNRVIYGTTVGNDAFVVKLSNDLNTLDRTAILTSSSFDYAYALAIDNSGNVFVGGGTGNSSNFADNRVIYGTTGDFDAFVVKLSNDLNTLDRTAILAGTSTSNEGGVYGLYVSTDGSYVLASSTTNDANNVGGAVPRYWCGDGGDEDIFIARLSGDLNNLQKIVIATGNGLDLIGVLKVYGNYVYVAGYIIPPYTPSTYPDLALGNQYTYGTSGSGDVFVISPRCEQLTPVEVEEKPQTQNEIIEIRNGKLFVKILSPKYIGFDVYELNGRIIYSKSLGFLPIGEYSYKLKLNKGSYIIKVRIGEEIRILKLVL